ncbi:MAG: trigger factor [Candidatus Omnitrophota bacterium]
MKIKVEDTNGAQKLIKIEVGPERVNAALDEAYDSIKKIAAVPGYRPGKAPIDLLKAHYDKRANEEAVNSLIWQCYRQAVSQQGMQVLGYPVVQDVNFTRGKNLSFSVKVDVSPEFKLKQYKGIKVSQRACEVTDEDIDKAIGTLRESMAQYNDIAPRPVKNGDYVVCLYECFENGKLVDKKDKLWLYINDKLQPKELLQTLLGAEIDTVKQAVAQYPKDYEYKELAGRQRLYKVTPKQIKEKTLPQIDDEFAKKAGNFSSIADLRKFVSDNIAHSKKAESQRDLERQIYEYLLKGHDFDVPQSFVQRQLDTLIQEAKQRLLYQGYKNEDVDGIDDKLKESLRAQAVKNVKLFFIIDRISKQESVSAEDEEVSRRITEIAADAKEAAEKVKERFESSGLIEGLKEQIVHDKVVRLLIDEAKS